MSDVPWLSITVFLPLVGVVVLFAVPNIVPAVARGVALVTSLATFAVSLPPLPSSMLSAALSPASLEQAARTSVNTMAPPSSDRHPLRFTFNPSSGVGVSFGWQAESAAHSSCSSSIAGGA